ncbi:2Fe-2S iron-sulfur cluster binding domain-containing protein [Lentibacillus halodurans]|uniref:2Fe-2S iron-sulfur cluster binding domain-containing protein n=1 Tax=Lentibacillus halodurans TaxID=237679 RepID=A0A1I1AST4_9BACI|nr:2Fe-2S iron-sulfur cluster-binding protein [Lentibacillus halodurans]SFB39380.1 2Fe-2S iron-sulfur cluster binding domain-containing protein [Lentibacillus halodurans]
MHITNHPIFTKDDSKTIQFYFNNKLLNAKEGQTIEAAIMANGIDDIIFQLYYCNYHYCISSLFRKRWPKR